MGEFRQNALIRYANIMLREIMARASVSPHLPLALPGMTWVSTRRTTRRVSMTPRVPEPQQAPPRRPSGSWMAR